MVPRPRYFANTARARRVAPGDLPGSIGVNRSPADTLPIGIAFEAGRLGGWRPDRPPEPAEVVWRLQVGGEYLDGRWALRDGEFVELAEDAD